MFNPNEESFRNSDRTKEILGTRAGGIPRAAALVCLRRLRAVRDTLRQAWTIPPHPDWGHLVDWVLAGLVAREHVLLLGGPGVAKNEIATLAFRLLDLKLPEENELRQFKNQGMPPENPFDWWEKRCGEEEKIQKYFHYQLSRFTQVEELFGPVEISLLRRGMLVRINFSLLTGKGVRAAFLDEIFKAAGSLLNSLLMLLNERAYLNWGGVWPADLRSVIAASNELPGSFGGATGQAGGTGQEDFTTLYAM